MSAARLTVALEQMTSGDWLDFEKFAAEFLASEYPSLRTTASPRGDRGRDGQMYSVDEEPDVMVQYSVTADWDSKIRATVKRLKETFPSTRSLIYVTNQSIGPDADALVQELRMKQHLAVDIRDISWFVARENTSEQRAIAADELAKKYADPLTARRGLSDYIAPAINAEEGRIALLHLALDKQDRATSKGLTKSTFEALVLAAIHDTSSSATLSSAEIVQRVKELLPAGHDQQIEEQVNGALARLSRKGGPAKEHGKGSGKFHLAYEESQVLERRLAAFLHEEGQLDSELLEAVRIAVPELEISEEDQERLAADLRFGLETVLLRRGEAFASAAVTGLAKQVNAAEILGAIMEAGLSTGSILTDEDAAAAIFTVLDQPSPALKAHLRRLADAYTMYAFLRQTPDVQKVVLSLFSGGSLWLDTNVILPLLAETLIEDPAYRHYTTIFQAAIEVDLKLYVTDGVLEEVERHINLCQTFARTETSAWRSSVPFLYASYALAGRARREFTTWLETFRGSYRPLDDIMEYLTEEYGIHKRNLEEEVDKAPQDLRAQVQEIWIEAHENRRASTDSDMDLQTKLRLASHDVENTVGIMQLRRQAPSAPMGYRYWFLTLDKTALSLKRELDQRLGYDAPHSPAISPDFMSEYLRISPLRTAIERELWANLPLLTDISRYEFIPKELITLADDIRAENAELDERRIRRRVRDRLDQERTRFGPEAFRGIKRAQERLENATVGRSDV